MQENFKFEYDMELFDEVDNLAENQIQTFSRSQLSTGRKYAAVDIDKFIRLLSDNAVSCFCQTGIDT